MELSQLKSTMLDIFSAENTANFLSKVKQSVLSNDFSKHEKYISAVGGDLSFDYMQKIFQYYEADRKNKMQDYTPKSLAESIAKLSAIENEKICYDMCSGSGALTIQKWLTDKSLEFICEEFDEKVIPLLLFNLSVRNIKATVIHGDVLSGERFKAWKVSPTNKFSNVQECDIPLQIKADVCISNPPYNMKWEPPFFAETQERFNSWGVAPNSNANYAFITTALCVADKVSMILPNGVLSTDNRNERDIREFLISDNVVESVVICPEKMFEATSIPVCLLTLNRKKQDENIMFVDMRKMYSEEQREQRGQFGGVSHENRVYTKTVNVFTAEQQKLVLEAIANKEDKAEFSKAIHISQIRDDFSLCPSHYIDFTVKEAEHRPYKDIIADINHIIRMRNMCKLVVNETLARQLGLTEILELKNSAETDGNLTKAVERATGEKLTKSDYIRLTKNKNEFSFVNNDREEISVVFLSLLTAWKQQIMLWNNEENRKLIELRNALLPDLMSGKIVIGDE